MLPPGRRPCKADGRAVARLSLSSGRKKESRLQTQAYGQQQRIRIIYLQQLVPADTRPSSGKKMRGLRERAGSEHAPIRAIHVSCSISTSYAPSAAPRWRRQVELAFTGGAALRSGRHASLRCARGSCGPDRRARLAAGAATSGLLHRPPRPPPKRPAPGAIPGCSE